MGRSVLISCLSLMFLVTAASAHTWYIKSDGTGDAPTIQGGIDSAVPGDTVLVASGTYSPSVSGEAFPINMAAGITLISESGADVTVIDAEQTGTVLFCDGIGDASVIEGLTITGGSGGEYPYSGGGILCIYGSSPEIRSNVITSNVAEPGGAGGYGGGIYCYGSGSDPYIHDNIISHNSVNRRGGGIGCDTGPSPTITGNTIAWNTAGSTEGGGGGIYCYGASPAVEHNLIIGNVTMPGWGGGIELCYQSHPRIASNTVVYNEAGVGRGAGIGISAHEPSPEINNNIVAENSGEGICCYLGSGPSLSCNDFWNNSGGDYDGCGPGTGDFSEDPLFCDPGTVDFRLDCVSPCVSGYGCGQVGAYGVGCGPSASEPTTWSQIKAEFGE